MANSNFRNIGRLGVIIVVSVLSIVSWFLVNSPLKHFQLPEPVISFELTSPIQQSEPVITQEITTSNASVVLKPSVIPEIPFQMKDIYEKQCPGTGPNSTAPSNDVDISAAIAKAVKHIRKRNSNAIIVSTTVNQEAAIQNLPSFLLSLAQIEPPLSLDTIVFCLDEASLTKCRNHHADPTLCIFMDMGISEGDLVPHLTTGKDFRVKSYWRLTYGRVFATLAIHNEGVSVLPVDVDAVFLKNPFITTEDISRHPDSIAGVVDSRSFDLNTTDENLLMNGGFLFFPSTNVKSTQISHKVLQTIWSQNCLKTNEQIVTSNVIKSLYGSLPSGDPYAPQLLSPEKYLNFCHARCGTDEFAKIKSLEDLHILEKELENNPEFRVCTKAYRKNWVFFHAACTTWPNDKGLGMAKAKGDVQRAILEWVKESRTA
jgi:Nucleotide-diphospho-sugar transferase